MGAESGSSEDAGAVVTSRSDLSVNDDLASGGGTDTRPEFRLWEEPIGCFAAAAEQSWGRGAIRPTDPAESGDPSGTDPLALDRNGSRPSRRPIVAQIDVLERVTLQSARGYGEAHRVMRVGEYDPALTLFYTLYKYNQAGERDKLTETLPEAIHKLNSTGRDRERAANRRGHPEQQCC
jgi:hypothetical protein